MFQKLRLLEWENWWQLQLEKDTVDREKNDDDGF